MSTFTPGSVGMTGQRMGVPTPVGDISAEQTTQLRSQINEWQHPTIVLNGQFKPVLLNDSLRQKLSEPATVQGTTQPAAFIWQSVCDTAARIAAEHAQQAPAAEIAQAFPVHQRCFVAVGSLIKNAAGQIVGALLNLADITPSVERFAEPGGGDSGSPENTDAFLSWENNRETALQRMARLSRRESQVVELVSDGLPNKSIAHELDISVKTIEKHRANATRKLGVGSTAELVRIAVVAGNKTAEVNRRPPEAPGRPPVFST